VLLLEEAVEAMTAMRMLGHVRWPSTLVAEAYLVLGRIAEARELADEAVAQGRASQEPSREAWGLKLLGDIYAHAPDEADQRAAEQAGDTYRQALALATELDMRPLVAHCHLGLGTLYQRTGKRQQAQEHLAAATTMYREMEMGFWLEQATAALHEAS
jgi:tetratricopeptide (TPR) repeat protein